ncbi:hypothetical protein K439DRAFT_511255 [Ramaria rubella]|nr:hypothetical protein K439DRAFT_511255 [Ramaria rubella]
MPSLDSGRDVSLKPRVVYAGTEPFSWLSSSGVGTLPDDLCERSDCGSPTYATSRVAPRLHASRDWEEHHQGHNYGVVIGGVIAVVCITLGGGYVFARWRRRRLEQAKLSRSGIMGPSNNTRKSMDSHPLLIQEHWKPTLHDISEHTEEPSASSRFKESNHISHPSAAAQPSRDDSMPLLHAGVTPVPTDSGQHAETASTYFAHEHPRARATLRQQKTREKDPELHEATFLGPVDSEGVYGDKYDGTEAPLSQPREVADIEMETPNVSASDSDSMQVNIPWRNSARFLPPRTQSLPTEPEVTPQELSSPATPRNERRSSYQPQHFPSSPLYLRAVAEEEREQAQSSASKSPTKSFDKKLSVGDVSLNESEGSENTSSLSSLARLKLRITGSMPFLPLIEESSPFDADSLWRRLRGDETRSRPISLKSKASQHTRPRSFPKTSLSSSTLPTNLVALPPPPASAGPSSPRTERSRTTSFPKPPPSPSASRRSESPTFHASTAPIHEPEARALVLTPDMPAILSPLTHSSSSPWKTLSSSLTSSSFGGRYTSSSSLPLSEFPEPPKTTRPLPRPLPARPLPHIPPPPTSVPPKPPVGVREPDRHRGSLSLSHRTFQANSSPITDSDADGGSSQRGPPLSLVI